jgi:predicted TIM-barrel fold metal-dependent hydrolase
MTANRMKIDLHHHAFPPALVKAAEQLGIEWTGGTGVPPWSLEGSRALMERHGIATAMVSVQPSVYWGDRERAATWAREGNEHLAALVGDDPAHFGGLASLPLPDTHAAIRELEYAFDTLRLDGVCLTTSVDGRYPGDPAFEELFHELNRRSAVVLLHPNTKPPGSNVPKLHLPESLLEFVFDTTRAVANLLYSGTLSRYPAIRFVLPHAGGTVPYVAWRLGLLAEMRPAFRDRVPEGVEYYLRRLYYETAISASPSSVAALMALAGPGQIVFGSDHPFLPPALIDSQVQALARCPHLRGEAGEAIYRENALALFPRLAAIAV